jgi:gluconolactonase
MKSLLRSIIILALALCYAESIQSQIYLPSTLVDAGTTLQPVKTGLGTCEGPVCDSSGNWYFSEFSANKMWKIPAGAAAVTFRSGAACNNSNGLVIDKQNRLIACEFGTTKRVTRTESDNSITVLAQGDSLQNPNDLTLCSDGGLFFTDPVWGGLSDVFYRSSQGVLRRLIKDASGFPNGIEFVEDKNLLYIVWSQLFMVKKYRVDAQRNITYLSDFAIGTNGDGLAIDELGNVWIANGSASTVVVFDSSGDSLGNIMVVSGKSVQNCAFGGTDGKTLLIAIEGGVYSLQTKVKGRPTTGALPTKSKQTRPAKAMKGSLKLNWDHTGMLRYRLTDYIKPNSLILYALNGAELINVHNQSSTGTINLAGFASNTIAIRAVNGSSEESFFLPAVR